MMQTAALTPRAVVTVLRCLIAAAAARIISRLEFRTIRLLVRDSSSARGSGDRELRDEIVRWITPAYTFLRRQPSCFEKAIALVLALRSAGIDSQLILGAENEAGFRAHAWVVSAQDEFLREADAAYQPVAVL